MGWASRANPTVLSKEHPRTKRLRTLCRKLPREAVIAALPKMRVTDREIVWRILDEVQPEIQH